MTRHFSSTHWRTAVARLTALLALFLAVNGASAQHWDPSQQRVGQSAPGQRSGQNPLANAQQNHDSDTAPPPPSEAQPATPPSILFWSSSKPFVENWVRTVPTTDAERLERLRALFVKDECKPELQKTKNGLNLICTLPGESTDTVVITAHYNHPGKGLGAIENWTAAAMLPLLYHAMQATTRHTTYIFAALDGQKGGQAFLKSPTSPDRTRIRAVLGLDNLGMSPLRSCSFPDNTPQFLQDLGLEEVLRGVGRSLGDNTMPKRESCYEVVSVDDTGPFRRAGIPTLVLHSVTHEKRAIPGSEQDTADAIDPRSYYNSYQLVATFLCLIDRELYAVLRPGAYDPMRAALSIPRARPLKAIIPHGGKEEPQDADLPPLPPPAPAPSAPPPGTMTIDVTAITAAGEYAKDLTRDRFQVIDDGEQQQIVSFEDRAETLSPLRTASNTAAGSKPALDADPGPLASDGTVRTAPRATSLPVKYYTNALPQLDSTTVLMLDNMNTPTADAVFQRQHLMIAYLKQIPPQTHVAVFGLGSRLWMFQGLAGDSSALLAAVDSVTEKLKAATDEGGKAPAQFTTHLESVLAQFETDPDLRECFGSEPRTLGQPANHLAAENSGDAANEALAVPLHGCVFSKQMRMQRTLEALQQILRYLDGIQGRKSIVWFAQAFPLPLTPEQLRKTALALGADNLEDAMAYTRDMIHFAARLREARVSIYTVNSAGINIYKPRNLPEVNKDKPAPPGAVQLPIDSQGNDLAVGMVRTIVSIWGTPVDQLHDLESIGAVTGGRSFPKTDQLGEAVLMASADNPHSFNVSYSPAKAVHDGGFRVVQMKVAGFLYDLEYPRGYFDEPPMPTRENNRERMTPEKLDPYFVDALRPDLAPATEIFFNARATRLVQPAKPGTISYRLDFNARYDPPVAAATSDFTEKGRLLFAAAASDAAGTQLISTWQPLDLDFTSEGRAKVAADGAAFQMNFDVPKAATTLTVGVYDPLTERMGTLDIPLSKPAQ
ncbi:MAG TPA: VWA domain-containing protein [Acidisarcina sp.]